jgi:hypothetical protein
LSVEIGHLYDLDAIPIRTATMGIANKSDEGSDLFAQPILLPEVGSAPMPMAPAEFGAMVAAETEKWGKVVKLSGVKAE